MNVLVVDDHPLARIGVISILNYLNAENEISNLPIKIMEAANVSDALEIINKYNIDLAIIDIKLQQENGLDIIEKSNNEIQFVILTSFLTKKDYEKAEVLGVRGYILKRAYPEDILYAIKLIMRGKKYYDSDIEALMRNNGINSLTPREKDVLYKITIGLSNKEISKELYISEYTTKKHVSSILNKLNVNSRAQLIYKLNNKLAM
ncbi:MAG: LuxR C-terminal-related transcriptional regulator [Clostridiaceae bacterium]